MTQPTPPSGITFDPTINAGHILTFLGFLISGSVAYSTLDTRITIVEQRAANSEQRINEQDARISTSLSEIKRDVKETNNTVNQLARELSRGRP